MKRIWALILVMSWLLNACSAGNGSGMEAHEAWTPPAAQGQSGDVYFVFHNHSSKADELTSASTDVAEVVEIQGSTANSLESVPLQAFADIEFSSDGPHLVLVNLKKELKLGDQFRIALLFKNSKEIKIRVSVRDTPPPTEE